MADRSTEPSGFARVFGPLVGLLAVAGLVAAIKRRPKERVVAEPDETPDGHPS
jgi:hypothetical protein